MKLTAESAFRAHKKWVLYGRLGLAFGLLMMCLFSFYVSKDDGPYVTMFLILTISLYLFLRLKSKLYLVHYRYLVLLEERAGGGTPEGTDNLK